MRKSSQKSSIEKGEGSESAALHRFSAPIRTLQNLAAPHPVVHVGDADADLAAQWRCGSTRRLRLVDTRAATMTAVPLCVARVLSIDLHVLSRSVERIFAPFYSSLDLSQLISHQLDAWHARGARGAGKSVTHRTPAPPRAGDVSTRLSHEKTRYHEAQAPFTRSLNQALLHSRQNRMPPPLAAPSLMPVRKNALALSQLNPSMGISPNRSCLR